MAAAEDIPLGSKIDAEGAGAEEIERAAVSVIQADALVAETGSAIVLATTYASRLLPYLPRLSRPLSVGALAMVTALSAPIDALFGRIAVQRSWHAVFVLERAGG